jgi:CTP synthase (UTP-ammonia lyase)
MKPSQIALVGERDMAKPAHVGIEASLGLYERETSRRMCFHWISTEEINPETTAKLLGDCTGIWCVPGSPYANTEGALCAIRFARENRRAFFGTCGGFQHALIEYAKNVLGRVAPHQELDPTAENPLIVRLSCSLAGVQAKVQSRPGSWFSTTVGAAERTEEFNCNYGMSAAGLDTFTDGALEFVAHDEVGQVRAFRLRGHPFYVGTLFQPERLALRGSLHPLVRAFFDQTCA